MVDSAETGVAAGSVAADAGIVMNVEMMIGRRCRLAQQWLMKTHVDS